MSEREVFLKALEDDEDDETTRLVFADWLEEHGEVEEAERHRKWKEAKAWFVNLCDKHDKDYSEYYDQNGKPKTFSDLIRMGCEAYKMVLDGEDSYPLIYMGPHEDFMDELNSRKYEFWKMWSIITGLTLSEESIQRGQFSCGC